MYTSPPTYLHSPMSHEWTRRVYEPNAMVSSFHFLYSNLVDTAASKLIFVSRVWPLAISKDEIGFLSITVDGIACKDNHGLTFWLQPFTFKPLIASKMSLSSDIYCLSDCFHNECLYWKPMCVASLTLIFTRSVGTLQPTRPLGRVGSKFNWPSEDQCQRSHSKCFLFLSHT